MSNMLMFHNINKHTNFFFKFWFFLIERWLQKLYEIVNACVQLHAFMQ